MDSIFMRTMTAKRRITSTVSDHLSGQAERPYRREKKWFEFHIFLEESTF